jgi:hypothetical protein
LEEEFNVVPASRAPEVSYLNLPFWKFPESTQLTSNINILGLFHLGTQWPPVGQAARLQSVVPPSPVPECNWFSPSIWFKSQACSQACSPHLIHITSETDCTKSGTTPDGCVFHVKEKDRKGAWIQHPNRVTLK